MEREIKFEIMLLALNEVNGHNKGEKVKIINNIFDKKNGVAFWNIDQNFDVLYTRQFTGLKDKNGKEIYDGDILFGREEGNGETTAWTDVNLIVFFKDGSFKVREKNIDDNSVWCDYLADGFTNEYEIIGNIYENPEMIEQCAQ